MYNQILEYKFLILSASNPLRGFHEAPIIDPYDSVVIGVNTNKTIECKGIRAVTWSSEVIF